MVADENKIQDLCKTFFTGLYKTIYNIYKTNEKDFIYSVVESLFIPSGKSYKYQPLKREEEQWQ